MRGGHRINFSLEDSMVDVRNVRGTVYFCDFRFNCMKPERNFRAIQFNSGNCENALFLL